MNSAKLATADLRGNLNSSSNNNNITKGPTFEVAILTAHSLFGLHVDAHAIRQGYYKKLYALQDKGWFWYTGAAFLTHDSSLLWQFSKSVVARIVFVTG